MTLLTVDELAAQLRVPTSWVYDHVREIPHLKLGRHVRFEQDAITAWLRERSA